MKVDRRAFLAGSLGLTVGAATTALLEKRKYHVIRKQSRSRVAILRAESYSHDLEQILRSGLDLFQLDVRGKTVLLKPNLVDFISGNHITTHPLLVSAAAQWVRCLVAKSVRIGEGPDHHEAQSLVYPAKG